MYKYIILISVCACIALSAQAQTDIRQIQSNPDYICAEGFGETFEEADNMALRILSSQIWTFISSRTTDNGSERLINGKLEVEEERSMFLNSFTSNTIPNARMIILSEEPDCKIFRYVHKQDIDEMENAKSERILDLVETGKKAEAKLQIDDALRNYYWAFMLAKSHTKSVSAELGGKRCECFAELPQKIKSVISDIKAELLDCEESNGIYTLRTAFTYNGHNIASLQFKYYNGQGFVGPLSVKDGIGELELVNLPQNNKLTLRYEYKFQEEAENLDSELRAAFETIKPSKLIDASARCDIPVKVNPQKGTIKADGTNMISAEISKENKIATEKIRVPNKKIEFTKARNETTYLTALKSVENAIAKSTPSLAKEFFTEEGYAMFETLLTKTGKITLSGQQQYQFIVAGEQILGRSCNVKIKFKNGKAFMEKIVFRFNPINHKIQSIALGLTQKAEDDIFNANTPWGEISRYTILQFMEDYQTAFALKRLDYLEQIFSDKAIIITGAVLNSTSESRFKDVAIKFGNNKNVRYTQHTKKQYLAKLKSHFRNREYIHLTFEDNTTGIVNTNGMLPDGAAFAIQIRQFYSSPSYSDRGYLTLFLNMQGKHPIIEVRLWQPEEDVISYNDFLKEFYIK